MSSLGQPSSSEVWKKPDRSVLRSYFGQASDGRGRWLSPEDRRRKKPSAVTTAVARREGRRPAVGLSFRANPTVGMVESVGGRLAWIHSWSRPNVVRLFANGRWPRKWNWGCGSAGLGVSRTPTSEGRSRPLQWVSTKSDVSTISTRLRRMGPAPAAVVAGPANSPEICSSLDGAMTII